MRFTTRFLTSFAVFLAASCSSVEPRVFEPPLAPIASCSEIANDPTLEVSSRKKLDTRCDYHEVLRAPERFVKAQDASTVPVSGATLILVGLEKPRALHFPYAMSGPSGTGKSPVFDVGKVANYSPKAAAELVDILDDSRPALMTHAVELSLVGQHWVNVCAHFSMYPTHLSECSTKRPIAVSPTSDLAAWSALEQLGERVDALIRSTEPTHIVVMSTGWNTSQAESIENYRWWMERISESDDGRGVVRPLYIGVSWESTWNWLPKALSVLTKGNDADEIGLTWVNFLVNSVVGPRARENRIPVSVVGHSYGTRVVGASVFVSDLISTGHDANRAAPALFVGLQGAFPLGRLARCDEEVKEPLWARATPPSTRVRLTTSIHDAATSALLAHDYAGGKHAIAARERMQRDPRCSLAWLGLGELDSSGNPVAPLPTPGALIDAKAVIHLQQPNTGGGAHSDVFTRQVGRFLWTELSELR